MACPRGEANLRVDFDRRCKLKFHGRDVSSDADILFDRELDDALGLIRPGGAAASGDHPICTG